MFHEHLIPVEIESATSEMPVDILETTDAIDLDIQDNNTTPIHNHDDRYYKKSETYTSSEINAKLDTKEDVNNKVAEFNNPTHNQYPSALLVKTELDKKASAPIIMDHIANKNNPHAVTKAQVGLGNVDNTSDLNKPISVATQAALNLKTDKVDFQAHKNNKNNPHSVTKAQVGLDRVDNTNDLEKPISNATQSALNVITTNLQEHKDDKTNPHAVTKAQVGLGNADNTSDMDKPISTATLAALDEITGSMSSHVSDKNNPHQVTKALVGLGNADNTSDADKPVSTATQAALDLKTNDVDFLAHKNNIDNPHSVTKAQVGLGNADNTSDLNKPISTATLTALDNITADVSAHKADKTNPHVVTKAQVGLGNVDNTSDLNKPISTATQAALDLKTNDADFQSHKNNKNNPHAVTKAQVGLGNVDNTSDLDKPISTATLSALDNITADVSAHKSDKTNPHSVTKAQVGLGNVDNTSDIDKPVSTATQTELNKKVDRVDGKGLSTNDYSNEEKQKVADNTAARHSHTNKSLLDTYDQTNENITDAVAKKHKHDNKTVLDGISAQDITNWDGKSVVSVSPSGTSETIGKYITVNGSEYKIATDLSEYRKAADQDVIDTALNTAINNVSSNLDTHKADKTNPHSVTKNQVGLGNVDNTSDIDKPVSDATQSELDKKVDKINGKGLSTNDYTTAEKTKLSGIAENATNVSVSAQGSSTDVVNYITINGNEKKIGVRGIAEGEGTNALVLNNTSNNTATGNNANATGNSTIKVPADIKVKSDSEIITDWSARGDNKYSLAKGENSTVEGSNSLALGKNSHAEGNGTLAANNSTHSEGTGSQATGKYSHAEGLETQAIGNSSHSEGCQSVANGSSSHSEGYQTVTYLKGQHSEGVGTKCNDDVNDESQHVAGFYNEVKSGARLTGNGSNDSNRRNIEELDWSGNLMITGNLKAAGLTDGSKTNTLTEILSGNTVFYDVDFSTAKFTDCRDAIKLGKVCRLIDPDGELFVANSWNGQSGIMFYGIYPNKNDVDSISFWCRRLKTDNTWTNAFAYHTLEKLTAGAHIAINNNVISATYSTATASTDGLMSATDKSKFDSAISNNGIGYISGSTTYKVSSDMVDDTNHTNKFVTDTQKTNWDNVYNKVPSQTFTEGNELADKTFVNSSIATATAFFLGTLDVVEHLHLEYGAGEVEVVTALNNYEWLLPAGQTLTNNDYCFVINKEEDQQNELHFVYLRYKYTTVVAETPTFLYEYSLNNSSFTAAQWAAINSGITADLVSDINANTAVRHSHSNKALLDTYDQANANLADAVNKKHEHSNKALLDTYTLTEVNLADAVTKKHAHDNKELLDTYNQTNSDITSAVTMKHTHSNKDLLDTYTQTEVNLADAVNKKHLHSNMDLLDTYTQTEVNLADAVNKKHSHSNMDLLDTYSQTEVNLADAVGKKHSHSNMDLLDTYTQTEVNLADAVNKKHSHANKEVIDGISASDITNWNSKLPALPTAVNDRFLHTNSSTGALEWSEVDLSSKQDASTAVKHTESTAVGSATQPVYVAADGTATATTYELNKTVPADAVFTDTVTTVTTPGSGNAITSMTATNGQITATKGKTFIESSEKGSANGVATLGSDGKLPVEQTNSSAVVAGSNVQLNLDTSTNKLTISATDTTYSEATTSASGLMSATDKTKLDSIDMSLKEDVANKVTSISSSSTDTEYPSAKAVNDLVENAKELFWCTYGTTTFEEVLAAVTANKLPIFIYNDSTIFKLLEINSTTYTFTATLSNGNLYRIYLSSIDGWSEIDITEIEKSSRKVTTLSSESTDTQYPSAKLVYDQLATKSTVSVATTGTSTTQVRFITVDGIENKLPDGGDNALIDSENLNLRFVDGTSVSVEANPGVQATATLTKLLVDNTVYSIGATGSSSWGQITGTLSNLTDLATALANKSHVAGTSSNNNWNTIEIDGVTKTVSSVIGISDGTNWSSLTIDGVTKAIPQSGTAEWGLITGNIELQTDLQELLSEKLNKLPTAVNNQFLHANAATGALEWTTGSAATARVGTITTSTEWSGTGPYTQVVSVTGVTIDANSVVDLRPDMSFYSLMENDGCTIAYIENSGGILTLVTSGEASYTGFTASLTIPVIVTEAE